MRKFHILGPFFGGLVKLNFPQIILWHGVIPGQCADVKAAQYTGSTQHLREQAISQRMAEATGAAILVCVPMHCSIVPTPMGSNCCSARSLCFLLGFTQFLPEYGLYYPDYN